jgi:uncharacterized protein (AIM24 family)
VTNQPAQVVAEAAAAPLPPPPEPIAAPVPSTPTPPPVQDDAIEVMSDEVVDVPPDAEPPPSASLGSDWGSQLPAPAPSEPTVVVESMEAPPPPRDDELRFAEDEGPAAVTNDAPLMPIDAPLEAIDQPLEALPEGGELPMLEGEVTVDATTEEAPTAATAEVPAWLKLEASEGSAPSDAPMWVTETVADVPMEGEPTAMDEAASAAPEAWEQAQEPAAAADEAWTTTEPAQGLAEPTTSSDESWANVGGDTPSEYEQQAQAAAHQGEWTEQPADQALPPEVPAEASGSAADAPAETSFADAQAEAGYAEAPAQPPDTGYADGSGDAPSEAGYADAPVEDWAATPAEAVATDDGQYAGTPTRIPQGDDGYGYAAAPVEAAPVPEPRPSVPVVVDDYVPTHHDVAASLIDNPPDPGPVELLPPPPPSVPSAPLAFAPLNARQLGDLASTSGWVQDSAAGPFQLGTEGLAVTVAGEMLVRMTGLVAVVGSLQVAPEMRRKRGRATTEPFGAGPAQLQRVSGHGVVYLEATSRFHAVDLTDQPGVSVDDEGAYLRESLVFGFEEAVSFENGRLASDALSVELVHLKGHGRVLLQLEGSLKAMAVPPGAPMVVPLSRLVGWFGRVTPRLVGFGGQGAIELTGDGFALLGTPG